MLFIFNNGKSFCVMLYIRVDRIHVSVVLCCDSEKVKSWVHAGTSHWEGNIHAWKTSTCGPHQCCDKFNAEIETAAEVVIMSRATFSCRTFINGFANVAIHMCPFVEPSCHMNFQLNFL